jgi:hypothetical protein
MAKANNGLGTGLTVAALAAGAAGAYYFYGKNGAKNRKTLKGWMVKAQGEVMEKVEDLTDVSQKTYYGIVEDVLKKYKKLQKIAPNEVALLTKELKGHWASISADLDKHTRKVAKR